MKLLRYQHKDEIGYGLLEGEMIIPLPDGPFEDSGRRGAPFLAKDAQLLPPCCPTKIICVGVNYRDHADECGLTLPEEPIIFFKPPSTLTAPGGKIYYPSRSNRVDFEAELAVVIKKTATNVPKDRAREFILGYTCANDVTARDLQPEKGQWALAKSFDSFLPLGPLITDEVDGANANIQLKLNGKVMQSSNTCQLQFSAEYMVSYISSVMTLYPGDVIITGTPAGIAPMQVGDVVEVTIRGIGTLKNEVSRK